jgi:hypothetical protein
VNKCKNNKINKKEISQELEDKFCLTPYCKVSRVLKFIRTESRMVVSRGSGKRKKRRRVI